MHPKKTTVQKGLELWDHSLGKKLYGDSANGEKALRADAFAWKQMIMDIQNTAKTVTTGKKVKPGMLELIQLFRELSQRPVVKSPFLAKYYCNLNGYA